MTWLHSVVLLSSKTSGQGERAQGEECRKQGPGVGLGFGRVDCKVGFRFLIGHLLPERREERRYE